MKRLYFIRHGESKANADSIFASRGHTPLSDSGRQQVTLAGQQATQQDLRIDLVLVSPLARTQQTADILVPFLGNIKRETYADIVERDLSPLEGQSFTDYRQNHPYSDLDKEPGVETIEQLQARAQQVLDYLKKRPEANILLVSHSAFGRALRRAAAGEPWQAEYSAASAPLPFGEILRFI